ncbi:MAG: PAS domain S-box protein [Bacteroidales bacterium]|nr:PAS domain S-box protein [Bacteroidales bacterium]MDD4672253.1 PAS domain S-box protein [Bacteroidales bacterium]MDY0348739.1 PAS domain S-box protein [Tenuifilaceae bacterium]
MTSHNTTTSDNAKKAITTKVVIAGVVGIVIVISTWILEFTTQGIAFSLKGIGTIHQSTPSVWIVNLLPFALAYFTYIMVKKQQQKLHKLQKELNERDKGINKNALFAKTIGEGNYNAPFELTNNDDILGKSLLVMRDNLLSNNMKEAEQNWITKGKDEVSHILRLHNNIENLSYEVLVKLINYINIIQGALYLYDEDTKELSSLATYAYNRKKYVNQKFKIGEGLIGQCAYEQDIVYRTEIPDDYTTITSGILGDKKPKSLIIVPLVTDEKLQGVLEFASIEDSIQEKTIRFLREMGEIIARTIFNLSINQKTEKLLLEAQQMTQELKENEEELRQNAEEMRSTHEELEHSNHQLESKIQEVENAQKRLHSLLENASEIISIYSSSQKLTYISPSVTKILGYTPQEMMDGKDIDRLTRRGEQELTRMFQKLLDTPHIPITIQYTFMKKQGARIYLEVTGRNLLEDPAINGIILNSQDITERKRAEKEERMRSKMQALSENSPDMIMRLNTSGQIFYANPMVEKYLGIPVKDLINQTLNSVELNEVLLTYLKETIKAIRADKNTIESDLTFQSKLGETIMHISAIPEFNENELETILFVSHDITEAKRIEKEIQDKNRKITESINYAQRIQTSILPNNRIIRQYLPKSFIYYKPRDVVSGDFPWFFVKDDYIYIAAVDCTGHGVPGALLSFIGYFTLNNVVDHDASYSAGKVLDLLHYGVRKTLKQDRPDADARDGMDIALCKICLKTKELQYSGAHRPLYLLRNKELQEFKGDRKAIGGIPHPRKKEEDFINYKIKIKPNDKIFFFSDGLTDQIGGEDGRKYRPQRVRKFITENQSFTMPQYYDLFVNDFEEYMGNNKQIDDVLLIGIEF